MGAERVATLTKPSGSIRSTLTSSASTPFLTSRSVVFPRRCESLIRSSLLLPTTRIRSAEKAGILQAEGDLAGAATLLAPLHAVANDARVVEAQVYQAILERRTEPIIPRLKEILAKPDPALGFINGELRFWLGWAQEVAGDACRRP